MYVYVKAESLQPCYYTYMYKNNINETQMFYEENIM